MARAQIDLSWLAGLLTPTPTAVDSANTPDLDIGSQGKFLDQNFNDVSQPYSSPSNWQRMIHPEQAAQIDQLNNQFAVRPLAAAQENQIKYDTALTNISRMPKFALASGTTPQEMASTGYGTFQTPVELAQQNRAMANMSGGITPIQSSTDINAAHENLEASNRALQRQPTVEAGLDQQSVNSLQKLLNVDQPSIKLAESQIRSELGREPTYEEVRERTLSNQLNEQKNLIPAQTQLSLTQTGNAQRIANETGRLWPYEQRTMENSAVGNAASSRYQPLGESFGNRIDNGIVTPTVRNPLGMSPMMQNMQLVKELTGENTQTITGLSGKPINFQVPTIDHSAFNPLDGGNVISATNMRSPVTHDISGSMSPGTSPLHSDNTLQDSGSHLDDIKAEMDKLEPTYYQYPNSYNGIRYKTLKAQYDNMLAKQQASQYIRPSMNPLGMNIP